jgi:hypothetical protein
MKLALLTSLVLASIVAGGNDGPPVVVGAVLMWALLDWCAARLRA